MNNIKSQLKMIYKLIWSLKRSTKLGLIMKSASGGNKTHHFFQEN